MISEHLQKSMSSLPVLCGGCEELITKTEDLKIIETEGIADTVHEKCVAAYFKKIGNKVLDLPPLPEWLRK